MFRPGCTTVVIAAVVVAGCDRSEALFRAARQGDASEVERLLAEGVSPDTRSSWDDATPLHVASMAGHAKVVAMLLEAGANVNARRKRMARLGPSPLREACVNRHTDVAALLLEAGADPNLGEWIPPLEWAVVNRDPRLVELLLAHGADVNVACSDGQTVLHIAARRGSGTTVRLLLRYGADVNRKNGKGRTAQELAERRGHHSVALLIKNWALSGATTRAK